mmetsp:Transcript_22477/g.47338  ORF Transcript_22477/g.47338 Transcript_22477/m.47338 type:complete len:82 (+) Transcript_22477:3021-3266(+)
MFFEQTAHQVGVQKDLTRSKCDFAMIVLRGVIAGVNEDDLDMLSSSNEVWTASGTDFTRWSGRIMCGMDPNVSESPEMSGS